MQTSTLLIKKMYELVSKLYIKNSTGFQFVMFVFLSCLLVYLTCLVLIRSYRKTRVQVRQHRYINQLVNSEKTGLYMLSCLQAEHYLANYELQFRDIVHGAQSQIIWFDGQQKTRKVIVYLHGFSATHQELQPLPQQLAQYYQANLLLPRLSGHARHGHCLAKVHYHDWFDDMWRIIQIASVMGDEIILLGNSTGASLINYLLQQPKLLKLLPAKVIANVQLSPNFAINHPLIHLLKLPFVSWFLSRFYRGNYKVPAFNSQHLKFWTTAYPLRSVVSLQRLLDWLHTSHMGRIFTPTLFVYNQFDPVVKVSAIKKAIQGYGAKILGVEVAV